MLNQLDPITMARFMRELCAAHNKPFGSMAEDQVKVYFDALREFGQDEVERAVKTACRDFKRWPRPSDLRQLIFANRPKKFGRDEPANTDRCRDCGTAYQWRRLPHWAGKDLGSMGAHDLQCDCGWRLMVRGYATDEDLAIMGPDDPFAAQEMRRRSLYPGRAA